MKTFLSKVVMVIMATLFVVACSPSKPTPPPNTGGGAVPLIATAVNISEDLTVFVPMLNNPFPLVAHGGTSPYTYTHTGTLPAGLSYSESTGEVSGTPNTAGGPVTIVYSVRDAVGTVASTTATVVYTVHPAPTFTISGKITGGVQAGVLMTLSPSGKTVTSLPDGTFSLSGVTSGTYTATPTLLGTTFTPASKQVTVNGANVTGVNFTTPVAELKVGKLLYPSFSAIRSKDLSTGVESVLYGSTLISIESIVPHRDEPKIAYIGSNVGFRAAVAIPSLEMSGSGGFSGWTLDTTNCWSWPADYPDSGFDVDRIVLSPASPFVYFVASALRCTEPGFPEKTDVFLTLADGTNRFVRVTNDEAFDSEPIICDVDKMTGFVTVLWVRNGTEIRKLVIDTINDLPVGSQTIVASNVMKGQRTLSANTACTHLAYMKNVGGTSHLSILSLLEGKEADLGSGNNPHWSRDGSNLILFTDQGSLWVINPDGTGKMSVPTPGNLVPSALQGGLSKVVFGPPGF